MAAGRSSPVATLGSSPYETSSSAKLQCGASTCAAGVADNRRMATYVRVYADADGETHFEEVELPRKRRESPTGTVDEVTAPIPVEGLVFRLVVSEASDTEPHNAPRRLVIVQVDGSVEVEVSDGEKRVFGPGSVLLVEDTTGKGHVTRSLTAGPRATLTAPLA